uniref:Uncharacterized protein n=1 Tax=Cacopsylla melanoneura TaxID=428564 RepID=A0A8D8VMW5_9HEMI
MGLLEFGPILGVYLYARPYIRTDTHVVGILIMVKFEVFVPLCHLDTFVWYDWDSNHQPADLKFPMNRRVPITSLRLDDMHNILYSGWYKVQCYAIFSFHQGCFKSNFLS